MEEKENIKEQQRKYDLASILNSPEDYSEEELRAFFSHPENRDDYRLLCLARKAEDRERISAPDVDKMWNAFQRRNEVRSSVKAKAWFRQTWVAVLSGAVAACVCLLSYYYIFLYADSSSSVPLVAMRYDETPQLVVLQEEGRKAKVFPKRDSVSFFSPSSPTRLPVASVSKAADSPSSAVPQKYPAEKMRMLSTPRGVDFKLTLPDGTEVWLNAESSLKFPVAFNGEVRKVILTGEAYFKVSRDEDAPFIVETDKMKVCVLGTEFNFRNYQSEKTQVSLVNGAISIYSSDDASPDIVLKPGEGACVEQDGQIRVLPNVDTYGVTQWVNGYFYFQNQPLISILQELGRWYNVGVVFENKGSIYDKIHFSALRSAGIDKAIASLNYLKKCQITLEDNKIVVR